MAIGDRLLGFFSDALSPRFFRRLSSRSAREGGAEQRRVAEPVVGFESEQEVGGGVLLDLHPLLARPVPRDRRPLQALRGLRSDFF